MATPEMLGAKHRRAGDGARPVGCLYLSSLIDTKGFPEFLEALQILAALPGPPIEATLCGRLVASDFSRRFRGAAAAETWIEQRLTEANRSARVRVRWVRGAAGAEKAALFRDAEIFVLPTRYTVEAQPLALLEAMATGCAIITSRAGEIPTILDESCAVLLASPDTPALADALQTLVSEADTRARLAHAAHTRFSERYQPARHLDEWEELLGRPSANSGKPVRR
jgi:glycosyltransferase involved in cell wall biosynthesis